MERFDLLTNELGAKIAKRIYNVAVLIEKSPLPKATQDLVMLRASQINGCCFCVDYHTKDAVVAGESATRLHLVAAWRESTVFTDAERAALALAEEATRIADGHHGVSDETWTEVRKHHDDEQTVALVSLVAMINANNRLNVIVRKPGGSYQPGMFTDMAN
ncbi:carboxymuconolactone decarboxylase family protein [Nonomuraea sp. NPDC049655]|uniref:carboxymuconolactone decarboxylase family protein n=1 Tax=Nonomuraea sp. NPDC049655 TaxID=3364355 RepID=UPI0037A3FBED